MMQAALFVALHVVGLAVCMALPMRRRAMALCCALAFPTGLTVMVLVTLLMLSAGVPYNAWTGGLAMASIVLVAARFIRRRRIDPDALRLGGIWTIAFALIASCVCYYNMSIMTYDSHLLVKMGLVIAEDGAFMPGTIRRLEGYGIYQMVAHSLTVFTPRDYLYGLAPVFALSFAPMFALLLWHALEIGSSGTRARVLLVALVTLALFSINMFAFHFFLVHTNFASAVFLLGFVALMWIAENTRDTSWLPIAFLFLTAFALQRIEAPVAALPFVALSLCRSELPPRALNIGLGASTLIVGLWFELLAFHLDETSDFLTPLRCHTIVALTVVFFAYRLAATHRWVSRLDRQLPVVVPLLAVTVLAAAFWLKPDHMLDAGHTFRKNLLELRFWGNTVPTVGALMVLTMFVAPVSRRWVFTSGVFTHLAFVLALAFGREPFRFHEGDSANRMALHVLPLVFFYIGLSLLARGGAASQEPHAQASQ